MDVVVIADTHLRGGLERLPERLLARLRRCDAIVHAGDVVSPLAVEQLRGLAPLHAVLGNNDHQLRGSLPDELSFELAGVRLAVLHDSGPSRGRAERLAGRFPGADLVVFGHSHVPVDEQLPSGLRLFNPGSPTRRRTQPRHTFGVLELRDGRVLAHAVVPC